MAVIYTPSGQSPITIGGTTGTGPFPKYGIDRSMSSAADGALINNVYTITITGQVLSSSSVDITVSGARQSDLHAKMIQKLQLGITNKNNYGRLEIVPYGGQPYAFDFIDARLIKIDIPQSSEDNNLNILFDYTFTFEATIDASNRSPDNEFFVSAVSETWDVSLEADVNFADLSNITGATPNKIYKFNHNVSATGIRSSNSDGTFDKSAWSNAKDWVVSRLVDSPASSIVTDFLGGNEFTTFIPRFFSDTTDVIALDGSNYNFYNHVRTPQTSFIDGQYSISESWSASLSPYTVELEVGLEESENGNVVVNANGSIQGHDTNEFGNQKYSKMAGPETYLDFLESNIHNICNHYYQIEYPTGTLRTVYLSKSIGRNLSGGLITFSYSFDDTDQLIPNAISSGITIRDDNELRNVQITAIIPIIARLTGPEIQNMNTTKERRRSVQFDCVMKKGYRQTKPPEAKALVLSYTPVAEAAYLDSYVEEQSPTTGAYNISAEWVY